MTDFLDELRFLADDPEDYLREGGSVIFTHHGIEHALQVRQQPGAGPTIEHDGALLSVPTYVQRHILNLPRVASQISRVLDKKAEQSRARPVAFIDGPARYSGPSGEEKWSQVAERLLALLLTPEVGTTQLMQLMAPAGQGKTVLLEHLARTLARQFQPDPFPSPLLVPVDLLGRYIGTIDDAIAGSLNNTFSIPMLTQRDVIFCIRQRWMILALDGFDELVARVGPRDAFARVTELLDQLELSGTVVLSARESFFAHYRITHAISAYLRPKRGDYTTGAIELLRWTADQGVEVFSNLKSATPEADFSALRTAFDNDDEIVLHPFFLTRLASLWVQGERFETSEEMGSGRHGRVKFVLDRYIERESGEKWVDRHGNPFLTTDEHVTMLGGIAEEMWRSNAFTLDPEELRLAAEMILSEMGVERDRAEAAVDRITTHAVLTADGRGSTFLHESFFKYCFGCRLGDLIAGTRNEDLLRLAEVRELDPDACRWCAWRLQQIGASVAGIGDILSQVAQSATSLEGKTNAGLLAGATLLEVDGAEHLRLSDCVFSGGVLQGIQGSHCTFEKCKFWRADLAGTTLSECQMDECEMSGIMINSATRFDGTTFNESTFSAFELSEGGGIYDPAEIGHLIEQRGGVVKTAAAPQAIKTQKVSVHEDALQCLDRMIRWSMRTCDIAKDELEEKHGDIASNVVRIGLESGILKSINRPAGGPKKEFVRFAVDRALLREGEVRRGTGKEIDLFWNAMAKELPRT